MAHRGAKPEELFEGYTGAPEPPAGAPVVSTPQTDPAVPLRAAPWDLDPADGAPVCPVGCRGTTQCLCGQGELSDHPVWIEND